MTNLKIDTMFAFVAVDKEGNEGVCAWLDAQLGSWIPLVGADMARVNSLKQLAKTIAEQSGQKIKLIQFTTRTEIEEI